MHTTIKLLLLSFAVALGACSADLTGTYSDAAGITRYVFVDEGVVKVFVLGAEVDAEYYVDDDNVVVSSAQGTVVLTRRDDRLYGPMGLELIRQSDRPKGE